MVVRIGTLTGLGPATKAAFHISVTVNSPKRKGKCKDKIVHLDLHAKQQSLNRARIRLGSCTRTGHGVNANGLRTWEEASLKA